MQNNRGRYITQKENLTLKHNMQLYIILNGMNHEINRLKKAKIFISY